MKKIITYGSFDLLHYGHINLLERAKKLGDYLIVGLATEKFDAIKGKKSYFSYEQRKKMLEALRCVDLVIESNTWEQRESDIKEFKVNVLVLGGDQIGNFEHLKKYCEIVYLPRTPEISTSQIKKDIK